MSRYETNPGSTLAAVLGHQAVGQDQIPERIDPRQAMLRRERDDQVSMGDGKDIRRHDQSAVRHACEVLDHLLDLVGRLDGTGVRLQCDHRLRKHLRLSAGRRVASIDADVACGRSSP